MDRETQQRQHEERLTYASIGIVGNAALARFFKENPDSRWPRRACMNPADVIALYSEWMAQFERFLNDAAAHRSQRMEMSGCKVLCTPRVPIGSILFE